MAIPKSIRDAFGSRWREGGGYSDAAQLQHNVEALVHDLVAMGSVKKKGKSYSIVSE